MKLITLLSISSLLFLVFACGESYEEGYYDEEAYDQIYASEMGGQSYNEAGNSQAFTDQSGNGSNSGGKTKMNALVNLQTGQVLGHIPLPTNWRINEKGLIEGPNGIFAGYSQGGMFTEQQRRLTSVQQVAHEDVIPKIKQKGGSVTNTFLMPEIAQYDQNRSSQYWKSMPRQDRSEAMGIEFNDRDGKKALTIIRFTYSKSQYGSMASYYMNKLVANPNAYDQAKKDYIYALVNYKTDAQYLASHNNREQQKSQASWNSHNSRMRSNDAAFQATQRAHVESSNAISDMSMQSFRNRNNASDRMQSQYVDGIWERQNMVDPYTGQNVQVDGYYNQYYMNNNNEYIGTDSYMYDPNLDPNMNNTEWRQASQYNYDQYEEY